MYLDFCYYLLFHINYLNMKTGMSTAVAFAFDVGLCFVCRKLLDMRTDISAVFLRNAL